MIINHSLLSFQKFCLIFNFLDQLACHLRLFLSYVITIVCTHAHFTTYSCVDMCKHTNHIRLHDHPTQNVPLNLINYSFTYICISVAHSCKYTMIIIIIMLYNHLPHVYFLKFPTLQIIMFINLYNHVPYMYYLYHDHH